MGRSKDLATGETRFANVSGDTFTGNVGIGGDPNKEFHVRDDNSFGNGSRIVAALSPSITNGQDAGLAFGTYSPDDYWKQGIFWERTGSYGLGHLHFANRGTADATTVSKSDAKMTINANGSVTKPSNPCAAWGSASGTGLTQNSAWSNVALGAEVFDKGNNYNTSNYRFTAPVAGVYLVGFSGEFTSTSNTVWSYLVPRINGSNTANVSNKGNYMADFSHEGTYRAHHQTWFLNLAENDYFVFSHIGSGGNLTLKSVSECQFFATLLG